MKKWKVLNIFFEFNHARAFILRPGEDNPVEVSIYRVHDPKTGEQRPPWPDDNLENLEWVDYTISM